MSGCEQNYFPKKNRTGLLPKIDLSAFNLGEKVDPSKENLQKNI